MIDMLGSIFESLLALVVPHTCQLCGKTNDNYLCQDCMDGINFIFEGICTVCGVPFISKASPSHVCSSCIKKRPKFTLARSICVYEGVLMDAVHKLKYHGHTSIAKPFGMLMAERVFLDKNADKSATTYDIVAPVPLHKTRLKERGFNQSLLLAREIAKKHKIQLDFLNLYRRRYTEPQINLKGDERLKNVKGAFGVKSPNVFKGKTVLLVDDVYTTGATVTECAKVLKKSGAKGVYILTLARVCRV